MQAPSDRVQAPFGRRTVSVTGREQFGPYVVIRCEDTAGPRPSPGQFYMLAAVAGWGGREGERPFLPRALSVMRALPDSCELEFLLEDVGPGTGRLCELAAGDLLGILGPLGIGFAPPRDGRTPVLVGGGVGIAPLVILRDDLGDEIPPPLLGFRDAHHAIGGRALLAPARIATDDGSTGNHGLVTDLLTEELHLRPSVQVYSCGPPAMLESVRMICAEHDVPAQLALESGMACGFGACFGCVVHTRAGLIRLCVDGPVIDSACLESVLAGGASG